MDACLHIHLWTSLVAYENVPIINAFVLSFLWFCFLSLNFQVQPGPKRLESRRWEMGLGGGLASALLSYPGKRAARHVQGTGAKKASPVSCGSDVLSAAI